VSGLRIFTVMFVLLTVISSVSVFGIRVADVEDVDLSTVAGAEETVIEAYEAVLEAETVGADVSGLLDRLDAAGAYLALARMCSRTGNMEGALGNASLSGEALDRLVQEAWSLRDKAVREAGERFWMAIGGSVVGVAMVICGGWLGWRWFKKRYSHRSLELKPEVVEGES
jgi:hypothetical protein